MFAMTTPTFADVDEALARHDYRASLSILESLEVVGEDACYRRDVQAAACADRLGLYPLCEEYATRARAYGDDMADPFALIARAQRRLQPNPAARRAPDLLVPQHAGGMMWLTMSTSPFSPHPSSASSSHPWRRAAGRAAPLAYRCVARER